jgi:hypothetical protein
MRLPFMASHSILMHEIKSAERQFYYSSKSL